MAPRAVIIYNPTAGTTNRLVAMQRVAAWWTEHGWPAELRPTSYAGHATELAKTASVEGVELILSAGGDGTLREVCNGVIHTDTMVGVLPSGTGNSFAKELKMARPNHLSSTPLIDASQQLFQGTVHQMDMIKANEHYGLLWVGVGAESYLISCIEPRPKVMKKMGVFGYMIQSCVHLFSIPKWKTTIHIDDNMIQGRFGIATICNGRLYGGGLLQFSPDSYFDDGQLEIVVFKKQALPSLIQFFWKARDGRHLSNKNTVIYRGTEITIETDPPIPLHIDGDHVGNAPITCTIVPNAVKILIPVTASADLFKHSGTQFSDI